VVEGELRSGGFAVHRCTTAREAREAIARLRPRLVVLDVGLPDQSGFELLAALRRDGLDVPVIMLTARLLGADKVRALDLGADDYVTKPVWPEELRARIRAVLRRHGPRGMDAVHRLGALRVDVGNREVDLEGRPVHLTPTEFDVLLVLVRAPNQLVPRERFVDRALPHDDSGDNALHVHISRLRRKLADGGPHIETVRGFGYRLRDRGDVA